MAKKNKSKKKSNLKIQKHAKDPRSRPGLYYGTDNLIYDKKTKQWIEDPKTFKPVRKA